MADIADLSSDELLRYARHLTLPGIGVDGQLKLKAARVLLVGAGGLGSPAALYLSAAGVGTLGIVDHDVVDLSNLQRQVLHETPAVGERKTRSASRRIAGINPHVEVETFDTRLSSTNAREIIARIRSCPGRQRQLPDPVSGERRLRARGKAPGLRGASSVLKASSRSSPPRTDRAIAVSSPNRRRRIWCRAAPTPECSVYCRASSARCRRWKPSSGLWDSAGRRRDGCWCSTRCSCASAKSSCGAIRNALSAAMLRS